MRERIARWTSVPFELVDRTLVIAAAAFFSIAAQTTTKAVRDGVFLTRFGLVELACAMLGMALIAGFLVSTYHRMTGLLTRRRALVWLQLGVAASMIALGEALHRGLPGAPLLLFIWAGAVGLVSLAELWLLTDDLFTTRDAKRAFSIVGAGAIAGGIVGGLSTHLIAPRGSPRGLLWLVAIELVIAAVLMRRAAEHRRPPRREPTTPRFSDGVRVLRESTYVRTLAVLVLCATVAVTTAEWQLKGLAKEHFAARQQELVAFFGVLGATVSGLSLLLQLFGTRWLLRRLGATGSLRLLPTSLACLAVMILLSATLLPMFVLPVCAAGIVSADVLRISVGKSASELLYLPLDGTTRAAAKRFVDTVVDRAGGALTAVLWLGLVAGFRIDRPERLGYASVLSLGAAAVWLVALDRMGRLYAEAQRRLIAASFEPSIRPRRVALRLVRASSATDAPASNGRTGGRPAAPGG